MSKFFTIRLSLALLAVCCIGFSLTSQAQTVSTLAGTGTAGNTDGAAASASFDKPWAVAVDASGNLYVADANNNKIRKITSAGEVSTLAGSGTAGSADGTGTAASFNNPTGVALDPDGNVYVADANNNKIRKITPAGLVSTLAGTGTSGSTDGVGTSASFNVPWGVAVDVNTNYVYVADLGNNKIRRISPAGVVSTFAGSGANGSADGMAATATFINPIGIVVDIAGKVYIVDLGNRKIRTITPAGSVGTLAGSGQTAYMDGTGTSASFEDPNALAVDRNGNVYVTESTDKIRMITPSGVVTTLTGLAGRGSVDGPVATATFATPTGVAVDASDNLYITDRDNNKIRKISYLTTGIEEGQSNAEGMVMFPNPVKNTLYFSNHFYDDTYELTDLAGRPVMKGRILSHGIDLSHLNNGIFFIKIDTGKGLVVEKVVKE